MEQSPHQPQPSRLSFSAPIRFFAHSPQLAIGSVQGWRERGLRLTGGRQCSSSGERRDGTVGDESGRLNERDARETREDSWTDKQQQQQPQQQQRRERGRWRPPPSPLLMPPSHRRLCLPPPPTPLSTLRPHSASTPRTVGPSSLPCPLYRPQPRSSPTHPSTPCTSNPPPPPLRSLPRRTALCRLPLGSPSSAAAPLRYTRLLQWRRLAE